MSRLPKVFVRYERDAVTKRMVRASTESNLPPLDKVSELKTRIKELESELKNTRAQSQWISVEDRLPDELESVLSFSNYDGIHQSIYRSRAFKKSLVVWDHEKVTHWMPLPIPPKTDE